MLSRLPNLARLGLWSTILFVLTLWLGTRHNDFPWYYHPDEPGKVEQVLGMRSLNFHHPMLLLNTTNAAVSAFGVAREPQAVVEAGRRVSAIFTASAVVALALVGYIWRGWSVSLIAGVALATHHQIFELSHYMKEDTALFFGLAVTFLAAHLQQRTPSLRNALLLGMGVGLAISGKTLGALALFIAVPVFISTRAKSGWRVILSAAVCAFAVFAVLNYQAFANMAEVKENSARELALVTGGQGMTQSVPHSRYWSIFLANSTPIIWILLVVAFHGAWRRRKTLNSAQWATIIFPVALAVTLSFFPKENDRYFLPASALFTLLAAVGTADLAAFLRSDGQRRFARTGIGAVLVLGQLVSWTDDRAGLLRYDQAFQHDDTADLLVWLRSSAAPQDIIAKDNRIRLPDAKRSNKRSSPLPNEIRSAEFVADFGPSEKLQAEGVDLVIISESTYMRFERSGMRPKQGGASDAERRRAFYAELRRSYEPVWSRPRSTVIYLHPGIEVFRLSQ